VGTFQVTFSHALEPLGFFQKMPSEVPNGYFLYKPPEFFHKILKNVIKLYLVGSL
jgi:hypothetical protein